MTFTVGAGGDTATSGDDYTPPVTLTATILAGTTSVDVDVATTAVDVFEPGANEFFTVTLTGASSASEPTIGLGMTVATGEIIGDDTTAVSCNVSYDTETGIQSPGSPGAGAFSREPRRSRWDRPFLCYADSMTRRAASLEEQRRVNRCC